MTHKIETNYDHISCKKEWMSARINLLNRMIQNCGKYKADNIMTAGNQYIMVDPDEMKAMLCILRDHYTVTLNNMKDNE